ncbi:hypothetical protein B0H13DRAFT_1882352 [Mycena leptocephala]|nr:hypothetical protein B0H13DRAFT_1882352 [Mycena leptocephala]
MSRARGRPRRWLWSQGNTGHRNFVVVGFITSSVGRTAGFLVEGRCKDLLHFHTSIPALHEYIQLIGEFHNLTNGIDLLSVMYQLLNRTSHVPPGDSVGPEITDRALTLIQSVDAIFKRIAAEVAKAVSVAERRSPTVFENIARTLKWNQYLMGCEGEYGANDLNADLTATILPSVQTQWHLGINVEIPALLSVFFQEIKVDLDKTIQTLQVRSSTNIDTVRTQYAVHNCLESRASTFD